MDWGLITGLAAICGVIVNFVRIGHWQGNIETRVDTLENNYNHHDIRLDELVNLINRQNELLTEVKVKLEMLFDRKERRRNG